MTIPQTLLNHPPWDSSDPDIKSEELLWVGVWSTFIIHWYSFIIGALFFGYSNLSLVHLRLKHRGHVFFGWDMVEKIALQGQGWYQAKIKVTVFFFKETIKNTEKDKVVKFMVYKNLQSNKSLAKYKKTMR